MESSLAPAVDLATAGVWMTFSLFVFWAGSATVFLAGVFLLFIAVAVWVLAAWVLVVGDLVAFALMVGVLAAPVDEVRGAVFLAVEV